MNETNLNNFKQTSFKGNSIILFMHPYNFYSQKILLVLYEKHIKFTTYTVDLLNGEQYSTWFLKLNAKGNVPVLKDGNVVVSESEKIINYLEKKFHDEAHETLRPSSLSWKELEKLQMYEDIIKRLPIGALSLGSFIHKELELKPKAPFIGPIRNSCLNNNTKVYELLKTSDDNLKAALLMKLNVQERRQLLLHSRLEYQKILDAVLTVLQSMENDLSSHKNQEWLISNDFTTADIGLGMLLWRLYQLGFEDYYWTGGKLPHIERYFLHFQKRTSCQKLKPSHLGLLKEIWHLTPVKYKIGAGVLGITMFVIFHK